MLANQDQGLTLSDVSRIYNMIGQNELALNCGTDRDDQTTVVSHSFLRHHSSPFAISTILDIVSSIDIRLAFWNLNITVS
jgi:hypothetical protein